MSRRQWVLNALKAAGASNDRQAWTRLYVENRVSYTTAMAKWQEGVKFAAWVKARDEKKGAAS